MSHEGANIHLEQRGERSANVEKLEELQAKMARVMEILRKGDDVRITEEDRSLVRELLRTAGKLQENRFAEIEGEKEAA